MTDERRTDFTAGPGGVMTDEVGVITGDLTLLTTVDSDGGVSQRVQYQQADEWYHVTGAATRLPAGSTIDEIHSMTVDQARHGRTDG